jgi:hypothetical protein
MYTTTTTDLLNTLADRVEGALAPEARAKATAATLRELARIPALPHVHAHHLAGALITVARELPDDDAPVSARRATCRELADLVPDGGMEIASVSLSALLLWLEFARLRGDGPRIAAIRTTARRELLELVRRAEVAVVGGFTAAMLETIDAIEARASLPGDGALRPIPSRREPSGIVIPPRPSKDKPVEPSDEEISRRIAEAISEARREGLASARLDLGSANITGPTAGPLVERVVAALREAGYEGAALDGRSRTIEIPLG